MRLIERLPVLALPAWRANRTQPIDGRDVLEFLAAAATLAGEHTGRAWDIGGPDVMSYQEMLERIAAVMLIDRPAIALPFNLTPVASVVAAAVAEEDPGLIEPLMESLEHDLLPRDGDAADAFGVRLHRFEAAVERALRDMEVQTMSEVRAKIDIAADPATVYDVMLDPARLHEWVTIHRKVNRSDSGEPREGFEMDQTLCLRHANFKVHWTLTEAERPHRATWEGKGPAGSYARTSYRLTPDGDGTHFEYENEFKAPGGLLGAAASRVLVGGQPEREAQRSLQQLKALLEH